MSGTLHLPPQIPLPTRAAPGGLPWGGGPHSACSGPGGMQSVSTPTGGAREPPARPSAGLRRGLAYHERAVSARWVPSRLARQSRGSPRAAVRPSRSSLGRRERGPPEMHGLRGRRSLGPPGLEGAPQTFSPRAGPDRPDTSGDPRTTPGRTPCSVPPTAQARPEARGLKGDPHSVGEKVPFLQVHMATSFRPAWPCSPLCPRCHL